MLENILALIKETVSGAVTQNQDIPEGKKALAIETTANAFTDGIKQNVSLENMSELTGLFKKGTNPANNPLTASIQSNVVNALISQVNLPQGVASALSSSVVPLIISAVSHKINDPNGKGFELKALFHNIWGKEDGKEEENEEDKSSLMDHINKLFGRKS